MERGANRSRRRVQCYSCVGRSAAMGPLLCAASQPPAITASNVTSVHHSTRAVFNHAPHLCPDCPHVQRGFSSLQPRSTTAAFVLNSTAQHQCWHLQLGIETGLKRLGIMPNSTVDKTLLDQKKKERSRDAWCGWDLGDPDPSKPSTLPRTLSRARKMTVTTGYCQTGEPANTFRYDLALSPCKPPGDSTTV